MNAIATNPKELLPWNRNLAFDFGMIIFPSIMIAYWLIRIPSQYRLGELWLWVVAAILLSGDLVALLLTSHSLWWLLAIVPHIIVLLIYLSMYAVDYFDKIINVKY